MHKRVVGTLGGGRFMARLPPMAQHRQDAQTQHVLKTHGPHPSRHRGGGGEGNGAWREAEQWFPKSLWPAGSTSRRRGALAKRGGLLWPRSWGLGLHHARGAVRKGSRAQVPLSPIPALLYKTSTSEHVLTLRIVLL